MMEQLLQLMLGAPGRSITQFLSSNPVITSLLLGGWLLLYLAGRFQLHSITKKTEALVVELSRDWLAQKPNMTSCGLYKRIYPVWKAQVCQWGLFVPNRLEIMPMKVRAEALQKKIGFSPEWILDVLRRNGVSLS